MEQLHDFDLQVDEEADQLLHFLIVSFGKTYIMFQTEKWCWDIQCFERVLSLNSLTGKQDFHFLPCGVLHVFKHQEVSNVMRMREKSANRPYYSSIILKCCRLPKIMLAHP